MRDRNGRRIFGKERGEVKRLKRVLQKAGLENLEVDAWVKKIFQERNLDTSFAAMAVMSRQSPVHANSEIGGGLGSYGSNLIIPTGDDSQSVYGRYSAI